MLKRKVIKRIMLVLAILIFVFIILLIKGKKTPTIKNAEEIYIKYEIENSRRDDGIPEYTTIKVSAEEDKDYLVNFFNNKAIKVMPYSCRCPMDNIIVCFETKKSTYSYGIGITGCGNEYCYNIKKHLAFPYEKREELLEFLKEFKEDYEMV